MVQGGLLVTARQWKNNRVLKWDDEQFLAKKKRTTMGESDCEHKGSGVKDRKSTLMSFNKVYKPNYEPAGDKFRLFGCLSAVIASTYMVAFYMHMDFF
jgi:hypothetical protein